MKMVISQIGRWAFSQESNMLIELINTEGINLDDPSYHPALINVFCAYREGKHLLLSDPSFLQKVSEHTALGNLTCNTAKNLVSKVIEYNQLKDILTYFCKVDFSNSSRVAVQHSQENNFFVVGYTYFNDTANIQITKLLCEDINDTRFYGLISKYYRLSHGFRGIDVKFEFSNGGGANTKSNFELIKSSERFCLCLLDSDKSHPKSGVGSTAAKFNSKTDTATCKHYILESHEIESLIPLGVIEVGLSEKLIQNTYAYAYEQTIAATNYKPIAKLYFDHKEGLTVSGAIDIDAKYNDTFWQDIFRNAKNLKRKGCLEKMHCDCNPPCIAIPGFGTGLLDVGTNIIDKMSHIKLSEIIPALLMDEWNKIGLKLTSWGCASSNRSRTS
nr:MAG TPA: hypothetical protein [Caudoviricetes sp.]